MPAKIVFERAMCNGSGSPQSAVLSLQHIEMQLPGPLAIAKAIAMVGAVAVGFVGGAATTAQVCWIFWFDGSSPGIHDSEAPAYFEGTVFQDSELGCFFGHITKVLIAIELAESVQYNHNSSAGRLFNGNYILPLWHLERSDNLILNGKSIIKLEKSNGILINAFEY